MNKLFGERTTLIVNLCAVVVAFIVLLERMFVEQHILGLVRTPDAWGEFVPVAVMFIIRNKVFSRVFLFLYVALALSIVQEVWLIKAGTPMRYDGKSMAFFDGVFFLAAVASLVVYLAAVLILTIAKILNKNS